MRAAARVVPGLRRSAHSRHLRGRPARRAAAASGAARSYAAIAADGGGIVQTVAATRAATEEELVAAARSRLDEMLACGTTTCEAKSGYGLDVESELRQLRAIRTLDEEHAIDIVPTFMGAHEIPIEYRVAARRIHHARHRRDAPARRRRGSRGILRRVLRAGRLHARGIDRDPRGRAPGRSDAARPCGRTGAERRRQRCRARRARSADHLVHVDERGADALADAGVCATLLPTAAFYLKLGRFAPARMLIDRGVTVALATDVNPGAGFSPSMPFAMTLACFAMEMTLEEALVAATLNAAWSLDRADDAGSLEPGKLMDAVIVNGGLTELFASAHRRFAWSSSAERSFPGHSHERTTNHQPPTAVFRNGAGGPDRCVLIDRRGARRRLRGGTRGSGRRVAADHGRRRCRRRRQAHRKRPRISPRPRRACIRFATRCSSSSTATARRTDR